MNVVYALKADGTVDVFGGVPFPHTNIKRLIPMGPIVFGITYDDTLVWSITEVEANSVPPPMREMFGQMIAQIPTGEVVDIYPVDGFGVSVLMGNGDLVILGNDLMGNTVFELNADKVSFEPWAEEPPFTVITKDGILVNYKLVVTEEGVWDDYGDMLSPPVLEAVEDLEYPETLSQPFIAQPESRPIDIIRRSDLTVVLCEDGSTLYWGDYRARDPNPEGHVVTKIEHVAHTQGWNDIIVIYFADNIPPSYLDVGGPWWASLGGSDYPAVNLPSWSAWNRTGSLVPRNESPGPIDEESSELILADGIIIGCNLGFSVH